MSLLAIEIEAAFRRTMLLDRALTHEELWGDPEPNVQLSRKEDRKDGAQAEKQAPAGNRHLYQAPSPTREAWTAIGV